MKRNRSDNIGNAPDRRHPKSSRDSIGENRQEQHTEVYCPSCEQSFPPAASLHSCPHDGTELVQFETAPDPMIGHVIDGRFKILHKLGDGGMGTVYRALQTSVGRDVAIKIIKSRCSEHRNAAKRFLREAKLSSRLSHPNIVVIHDFGHSTQGVLYIVMELITGRTLRNVLHDQQQAGTPMPLSRIIPIGVQFCDALDAAHRANIIHRDLKPANIMLLDHPHDRDHIKVLDFGLAKSLAGDSTTTSLTDSGAIMGTPRYMSPEMIGSDEVDERSDLYSLGCILYAMAAGHPPFSGNSTHEILASHLFTEPKALTASNLGHLPATIASLLAKKPSDRPNSAAQVRELLTGKSQSALRPTLTRAHSLEAPVGERSDTVYPDSGSIPSSQLPSEQTPSGNAVSVVSRTPQRRRRWLGLSSLFITITALVAITSYELTTSHNSTPPDAATPAASTFSLNANEPALSETALLVDDASMPTAVAAEPLDAGHGNIDVAKPSVVLTLRAKPRAAVAIDGNHIGRTPIQHRLPKSEQSVNIEFSRRDYRTTTRTITPIQDDIVAVTLKKRRRAIDQQKREHEDAPKVKFILPTEKSPKQ